MANQPYASSSKMQSVPGATPRHITEFDLLKASHKFLREDDEKDLTWEDQMARKYYERLFREFAVCDLKHYKSGNFALRWRTEAEVLSGSGEDTCGNTRCTYHETSRALPQPKLNTVELPFTYEELGENKFALVKVVLCDKCLKKLMWKREKEREKERAREGEAESRPEGDRDSHAVVITNNGEQARTQEPSPDRSEVEDKRHEEGRHHRRGKDGEQSPRRSRHSRSRSPARHKQRKERESRRHSRERHS